MILDQLDLLGLREPLVIQDLPVQLVLLAIPVLLVPQVLPDLLVRPDPLEQTQQHYQEFYS